MVSQRRSSLGVAWWLFRIVRISTSYLASNALIANIVGASILDNSISLILSYFYAANYIVLQHLKNKLNVRIINLKISVALEKTMQLSAIKQDHIKYDDK